MMTAAFLAAPDDPLTPSYCCALTIVGRYQKNGWALVLWTCYDTMPTSFPVRILPRTKGLVLLPVDPNDQPADLRCPPAKESFAVAALSASLRYGSLCIQILLIGVSVHTRRHSSQPAVCQHCRSSVQVVHGGWHCAQLPAFIPEEPEYIEQQAQGFLPVRARLHLLAASRSVGV